jgi:hypothetical protein
MTTAAETVTAMATMTATTKVMLLAMAMASTCSLYNSNSDVQSMNFAKLFKQCTYYKVECWEVVHP